MSHFIFNPNGFVLYNFSNNLLNKIFNMFKFLFFFAILIVSFTYSWKSNAAQIIRVIYLKKVHKEHLKLLQTLIYHYRYYISVSFRNAKPLRFNRFKEKVKLDLTYKNTNVGERSRAGYQLQKPQLQFFF